MTIQSYRDLVCWQVSSQLRDELVAITARSRVARDFEFCQQLSSAARSGTSNIAEGFGRSPRIFMRHLDIAIGSLQEAESLLDEALVKAYVAKSEYRQLQTLCKRASVAARRLWRYLDGFARRPTRRTRSTRST